MSTIAESQVTTFELQQRFTQPQNDLDDNNGPERGLSQELRPVDRGRDAWVVLISSFVFEALFWGFPMCFGVFQNYYSKSPEFQDGKTANIPLIGTLAQGLVLLGAPFSAMLTKRFPKYQRQQIWIGWPMCIMGLLGASFSTSVSGLIGTQGFLYGLGFVILTYPIISMVNEWWVVRKGMAFGLISAASGATGAFMPFILDSLLAKYGYQTTLKACAIGMLILTAPLIPLLKGRLPVSDHSSLARTDLSFLKKPLFWVYGGAMLIQGVGSFLPVVFLPSYASSIGLTSTDGAVLLAVMCIAQVLGQFVFGYLSDKKLSVSTLATVCCVMGALASYVFWGLAKSMPFLIVFSLVYGFFAFGFTTMRVAMGRAVSDDPSTVFATYSIYVFMQGLGNIMVTPISAALMSSKQTVLREYGAGLYGSMALFTGTAWVIAGLTIVGWSCYTTLSKVR